MPQFPLLSCSLLLFRLRYFPPYVLSSWHYCLHGLCLLSSFLYSPYFLTIPTIPFSLVLYVCVTCLNACRITFPLCCSLNELFTTSIGIGLLPSSPLLIVGSAYNYLLSYLLVPSSSWCLRMLPILPSFIYFIGLSSLNFLSWGPDKCTITFILAALLGLFPVFSPVSLYR